MNKCIVLGVDAPLSPATRQAIRTLKEFVGPMASQFHLILLHVIPIPYVASPAMGMYTGHISSGTVTVDQRLEAEKVLATVRNSFQEEAASSMHIDICIRLGTAADEIITVAGDVQADIVIVGSRVSTFWGGLRRIFMGSKSAK